MPARVKVVVTGRKDIDRRLHAFPLKLQKKVIRQAMRAGMKLMAEHVRQLAPVLTGTLRDNVVVRAGFKSRTRRGTITMDARIDANDETKRTSAKTGKTVFYPAIVEYGVKGRGIRANDFMLRAFRRFGDAARRLTIRLIRQGIDRAVKG